MGPFVGATVFLEIFQKALIHQQSKVKEVGSITTNH